MNDKLRNFIVRTLSGAVLLLVILAAMWAGVVGYLTLLLFITIMGAWEFYSLAKAKGYEPQRGLGVALSVVLYGCGALIACYSHYTAQYELLNDYLSDDSVVFFVVFVLLLVVIFVILLPLVFFVEVFRNRTTPIANVATTIAGVGYVAFPMAIMTFLPLILSSLCGDNGVWKAIYFIFYLLLVWGNDVFAYLVGVTMGRHKMCVRLSPKKSWEGFFGGLFGSVVVGLLGAYFTDSSYGMWLGLALVVSLSSVLGDLVESMFKRDAGVKDSGKIMPGHGGILDRFDALILSAPMAFIYLLIYSVVAAVTAVTAIY